MKIDNRTEKLVQTPNGLRIEGEETIVTRNGRRKEEHIYRWMRYVSNEAEKKVE